MLEGPLLPAIVSYAVPIIFTSVLQLLFNAADLVVVGQFCGSVSVAAVGSTSSLTNLLVNFFIGLSIGAGITVAHGLGSREDAVVQNTVHTAIPTALVSGVALTVVGVCFSSNFLEMMGTPDNVLPLSTVYMQIYFCGSTFTMVYNFCAAILRAAGDTKGPLAYLTIAGIVNVILNIFFVTQLDMNVAGVALATTISQGISAVLVTWALMKREDACRFSPKKMRFHPAQLSKILRLGLPAGIQSSLFSISNVLIQSSVNSFGDVCMSGSAAAGNIEGFVFAIQDSFQQTAVNFTGQNMGAHKFRRARRILWTCMGCVTVVGLVFGFSAWYFGEQLLSIYITDSPTATAYGMVRLSLITLPYFLCGQMNVSTGALRGMGASLTPMIISILGICAFRVFWIYTFFQAIHTPECLFVSYPISWALTLIAQMIAYFLIRRKYPKEDCT
ncbi:MAG TPA: MATE family efflux transporter [Clostridiales bacterium]|nr:MATE family efflux transporter [Clostridiales bacterium]